MKTEVFLSVDDSIAKVKITGKITAGAVGIPVHVDISGERWNGLVPKFVASCESVAKQAVIVGGDTILPHECLISKKRLYIGVDGVDGAGDIRIPTIWAYCGEVAPGVADVTPDNTSTPTQDIVDQILYMAGTAEQIASDVESRADNHEFDGFSPTVQVDEDEDGFNITITDRSGDHEFYVANGKSPEDPVLSVNDMTGDVKLGHKDVDASAAKVFGTLEQAMLWMSASGNANKLYAGDVIHFTASDAPALVITEAYDEIHDGLFYGFKKLEANTDNLADVAKTGEYSDLLNKPSIPNVPAWAMSPNKPTYTAQEVGTYKIQVLTKAEYDSIAIKLDDVVYLIKED